MVIRVPRTRPPIVFRPCKFIIFSPFLPDEIVCYYLNHCTVVYRHLTLLRTIMAWLPSFERGARVATGRWGQICCDMETTVRDNTNEGAIISDYDITRVLHPLASKVTQLKRIMGRGILIFHGDTTRINKGIGDLATRYTLWLMNKRERIIYRGS